MPYRSKIHTVDIGDTYLDQEPDFITRDGLPGTILWKDTLGFAVAVHTDNGEDTITLVPRSD